eukprot:1235826-Amphidinium_carterae.1
MAWRRPLLLASVGTAVGPFAGTQLSFFASAARPSVQLPVQDLSVMHLRFGGDASVRDNLPQPQQAPSGGTISALRVQIPALQALAPYIAQPRSTAFDLGFGSGVMMAMLLAVAGKGAIVTGVDLEDKIAVARRNLLQSSSSCPFTPFAEESFNLLGGDAFSYLPRWHKEGR